MGNSDKTKEQLLAELETLQRRVETLEAGPESPDSGIDDVEPPEGEIEESKRSLIKAGWVAPVILAVNLPSTVFAGDVGSPPRPTPKPSPDPA